VQRIFPPLRIHTWGGLGSQLFAIALSTDIQKRYPSRRIQIVLHTGGVTQRLPEVKDLFPQYSYSFVDDYRPNPDGHNDLAARKVSEIRTRLRSSLKKLLHALNLTASANDDSEYLKLKPWVLSCRGHYSFRTIGNDFLRELDEKLRKNSFKLQVSESCTLHYRLGDLLTLAEKSPIPSDLIVSEINKLTSSIDFHDLFVFSDSPERVYDLLNGMVLLDVKCPEVDTINVLANSIDSKYFIGTSSKISFWIAGVRAQIRNRPSLLPSNNLLQFAGIVGESSAYVSTYEVKK
jgi:hypothetical protein